MKWKHVFWNLKLHHKIILIFAAVLISISVTSGVIYYHNVEKLIVENFRSNADGVLYQIKGTIENNLDASSRRIYAMLGSRSFIDPLTAYLREPSTLHMVQCQSVLSDFLQNFCLDNPWVDSIYIHTDRGDFDNFILPRRQGFSFDSSVFAAAYEELPQKASRWFPAMENLIFRSDNTVIPYVRRFLLEDYPRGEEYLVVQFDRSALTELIEEKCEDFDRFFIFDSEGNNIVNAGEDTDGALLPDGISGDIRYEGEDYYAGSAVVELSGWQIVVLKSKHALLGRMEELRGLIVAVTAAGVVAGILCISYLARRLTSSLIRLSNRMNCLKNGDLEIRFFYPYRDEVGVLGLSFNYMADEIQGLVEKLEQSIEELRKEKDLVAEVQKKKRKAELRALQAQINPHFLYNTLNTITWEAADQGAKEASILSSNLGRFYRLGLSRGADVVTLKEELEHVVSYLNIQSIRYRDILKFETDIQEDCLRQEIIKLVLQPLVENSLYHGIKEKGGCGHIRICAEFLTDEAGSGNAVRIMVEDDGAGIPEKQLKELNEALSNKETDSSLGYGIYNVNERLKLYYGPSYGLYYESKEGKGTRAVIIIPARQEGDER